MQARLKKKKTYHWARIRTAVRWIFSSFKRDLIFVLSPGHLCLIVLLALGSWSAEHMGLLTLGMFILVDNGHVYTTFIRTFKENLLGDKGSKYALFVLGYFFVTLGLQSQDPLLLWRFAFYATYYHYVRQNLGLLIFYQKISGKNDKLDRLAIVAFQVLGGLAAHFRIDSQLPYYSDNDLYSYPDPLFLKITQTIYVALFVFWLLRSVTRLGSSKESIPGLLFMSSTVLMFGYIQFESVPLTTALIALIASHGIPYIFLLKGTAFPGKGRKALLGWLPVLGVLVICGFVEYYANYNWVDVHSLNLSFPLALFHSLFLLPLFSHFFFDALIWKGNNPAVRVLMKKS